MDFTGKVVIITGASSGIGARVAEYLSTLGAKLIITGRNEANLKVAAERCTGEVFPIIANITSEDDRVKVIDETIKKFSKLDVLVNNAGIAESDGGIMSIESFDRLMNTNVRSMFHLTQLAAPHLIKSKGNIVNIVAEQKSSPGLTAFNISMAALDQFTRYAALDFAPEGVRVNSVKPLVNPVALITPYNGHNTKVARTIALLACNEMSSFVTGATLAVNKE